MIVTVYEPQYFDSVGALWADVFPDDPSHNRADRAIPAKVAFQPDLFFVALTDSRVIGTVMAGYDGHRGWLYTVAVDRQHRRMGVATALVRRAEQALAALGCVKINLQVRTGNEQVAAFYESIGYVVEPRVSMGKRLT